MQKTILDQINTRPRGVGSGKAHMTALIGMICLVVGILVGYFLAHPHP